MSFHNYLNEINNNHLRLDYRSLWMDMERDLKQVNDKVFDYITEDSNQVPSENEIDRVRSLSENLNQLLEDLNEI